MVFWFLWFKSRKSSLYRACNRRAAGGLGTKNFTGFSSTHPTPPVREMLWRSW